MYAVKIADDALNTPSWSEGFTRPICGPSDVLIRVAATACNRADLLQRRGLYPVPVGASTILGLEAAGTIAEVGALVSDWRVGDRVCCLLAGGGHGEYVASPAELLLPVPDTMSFVEAAAIPEVFYTAFLNLFIEGELEPGDRVLIHAGGSGVGTAAIQLAAIAGADPIIATASESKLEALSELGAYAIDRHSEKFADIITAQFGGVDLILDPVAADYFEDNLSILEVGGRLVVIGLLGGRSSTIDLARLLMRRIRVMGSVLRSRSVAEKAAITMEFVTEVWPLFASGTLKPVIDSVFEIDAIADAHALLESNATFGKIVLKVPSR